MRIGLFSDLSKTDIFTLYYICVCVYVGRGVEQIGTLFGSNHCIETRESALSLTKRLAQTAQETFGDFEEAVEKDATKTAVLDGTVHPLTSYVINYVKFLFE